MEFHSNGCSWLWRVFAALGSRALDAAPPAVANPTLIEGVLLNQWRVAGPFPVDKNADKPLDTVAIENESELSWAALADESLGPIPFKTVETHTLDFRRILGRWNTKARGPDRLCRGSVRVPRRSRGDAFDRTRRRRQSLAQGDLVLRKDGASKWCGLDQITQKVSLAKGTNRLVLKVQNNYGEWKAIARFLPKDVDLKKPVVEFLLENSAGAASDRYPNFHATFFDGEKNVVAEIPVSGNSDRKEWRYVYRAYSNLDLTMATHVRLATQRSDPVARNVRQIDESFPSSMRRV